MAKLTMEDGRAITIRNVALFLEEVDVTQESDAAGASAPGGGREPDRCEYTISRRSSSAMRYMARAEIELPSAAVFGLVGFEIIRDSHASSNVRVRSRVAPRGA